MSEQQYNASQGSIPPPPIPSDPPVFYATQSPQYANASVGAMPQPGVSFTPMSTKSRRRIKWIVGAVVTLTVLGVAGIVALMIAN